MSFFISANAAVLNPWVLRDSIEAGRHGLVRPPTGDFMPGGPVDQDLPQKKD
jgi:hypothetical protein